MLRVCVGVLLRHGWGSGPVMQPSVRFAGARDFRARYVLCVSYTYLGKEAGRLGRGRGWG